uniref:Uncharacterized protein n=1 Tax=Arundo donax TaxID=35708 RepID=A0A0A9CFS1_ARUDO
MPSSSTSQPFRGLQGKAPIWKDIGMVQICLQWSIQCTSEIYKSRTLIDTSNLLNHPITLCEGSQAHAVIVMNI